MYKSLLWHLLSGVCTNLFCDIYYQEYVQISFFCDIYYQEYVQISSVIKIWILYSITIGTCLFSIQIIFKLLEFQFELIVLLSLLMGFVFFGLLWTQSMAIFNRSYKAKLCIALLKNSFITFFFVSGQYLSCHDFLKYTNTFFW